MSASSTSLTVGVLAEHGALEHRVALDPDAVARLVSAGHSVMLEYGSGTPASFLDWAYITAGASLAPRVDVQRLSDVLPVLGLPAQSVLDTLRAQQVVIGVIDPVSNVDSIAALADRGITVVALDFVPHPGVTMLRAIESLAPNGVIAIDPTDEFHRAIVICHGGKMTPAHEVLALASQELAPA